MVFCWRRRWRCCCRDSWRKREEVWERGPAGGGGAVRGREDEISSVWVGLFGVVVEEGKRVSRVEVR